MAVVTVTRDNFEAEIMQSQQPVLVDFWASWCGPCRMLSPIVEQFSDEEAGVKCCKVNVDDEPELAARFNVMNIPALFVVKEGKVVNSAIGVQPKDALKELIK